MPGREPAVLDVGRNVSALFAGPEAERQHADDREREPGDGQNSETRPRVQSDATKGQRSSRRWNRA